MDVKPHRPLRAGAVVSGSENILSSQPSIHNRHKSAGNLKAMAATGALNAPPKRTAFGDVSNIARPRAGDLIGKPVVKSGIVKEAVKTRANSVTAAVNTRDTRVEEKENRRGRASTKNGAVTKDVGHGAKYHSNAPMDTRGTIGQKSGGASLAQPPLRNGVSKKLPAVYQDRQEPQVSVRPGAESPVDDLAVLAGKPVKNPRHYKSQPVLRAEQQQQGVRHSYAKPTAVQPDDLLEVEDEADTDDNATEAAYEDAVEQLPEYAESVGRNALVGLEQANYVDEEYVEQQVKLSLEEMMRFKSPPPPPSEPEEYWDEEEEQEQELYDEQGYTTAHSFRSHGDNTTSGPTTLLAPIVTADVREELELAKDCVLQNQTEEEVEEEAWDVSMVAEYGDEIFEYMRELENQLTPNAHYMDDQTEIQWSMRSVLMDWLVQVHHRFCLLPETLFLTVNCIDRFLSVKVVSLGKLQLVGATALFVAAKYEEINCPSVQEIVFMVDSGYCVDEILKAERFMLSMLHFELGWPGPMSFLRRISKADDYDLETRTLAKYFLEITIMDERFVSCPPSYLSAGAHFISRLFLGKGDWTPFHVHYSGYTLSQLKPLVKMLFECCQNPRKHHGAVYDKYATPKYKHSSTYIEERMQSGVTLARLYAGAALPDNSSFLDDNTPGQYQVAPATQASQAPRNFISIQG
ncbi:cyclin-like protein [Staphylotrichum tortipilum]|uniref:Cyclin-like protein n=1 Tax=Staphylotrichum tortipilum TaxID=2831512 RepID=A0AAN6MMF0_9PEZI|nr:cyclin-like protein [Staphylotrichum longicolle]